MRERENLSLRPLQGPVEKKSSLIIARELLEEDPENPWPFEWGTLEKDVEEYES
jgi:hypothetical protein